jgi:hypothetical protein
MSGSDPLAGFKDEPWRLVEVALALAKDDVQPDEKLDIALRKLEEDPIRDLLSASTPFWEIMALPERDKGLRWLDHVGLLSNLLPCWGGNPARKKMRLNAVEQIHLETWNDDLDEDVVQHIREVHDTVIDGRLNGWALTALSTLLAGGDTENQYFWAKMVRRQLHELGATEAEIVWIENIVAEYRKAIYYLRGEAAEYPITAQLAITLMSTITIAGEDNALQVKDAAIRLNKALKNRINPLDSASD